MREKCQLLLLCSLCLLLASACRTKRATTEETTTITREVPVTIEKVLHDTLRVVNERIDSIYLHDSIFREIWREQDTVYITTTKYKTEYRDRVKYRDSVRQVVDTVEVPIEVHDTLINAKVDTKVEYRTPKVTKAFAVLGGLLTVGIIAYIIARVKGWQW